MRIDKWDLFMCSLIGGLVICNPLIGVYYGVKWIINHTPSKIKNKEEQDLEIHKLEQKLGLIRRDNKALHYDPHYYKINLIFISN